MNDVRELPKYVTRYVSRGREYFYFQVSRQTKDAGMRVRINNPWNAREITRALVLSCNHGKFQDWEPMLKRAYTNAKNRARTDKIEFTLTMGGLTIMLNEQGHKCAVSGIHFEGVGYDHCRLKPFSMSLDRIEPGKGYTADNVRIVSCIANFALGQWGITALERLATGIESMRRKQVVAEDTNCVLQFLKSGT